MKTNKYKHTHIVKAEQWFRGMIPLGGRILKDKKGDDIYVLIPARLRKQGACPGDWIIKDEFGQLSGVSPITFKSNYAAVEEEEKKT